MAVPTALQPGKNVRIYVSTDGADASATLLRSMNSITNRQDTSSDSTPTFDDDPAPTTAVVGSDTYAIGGLYRPGDPGQEIVRTARRNGDTVFLHVYATGDVGWKQEVSVGGGEWGATPGPFQPWSFDATGVGAKATATRQGYAGSDTPFVI